MNEPLYLTDVEIEDVVVAQAERQGACVCSFYWNVPLVPLRNQSLPAIKKHSRCPLHGDMDGEFLTQEMLDEGIKRAEMMRKDK